MKSHTHYLWFNTKQRQEIIDVTEQVAAQVGESGVAEGLVLVSAMHITASVFVNDHESGLWADILKWLEETVAPWDPGRYRHKDRKSTRLNSSHSQISYAVFCLKKKKKKEWYGGTDNRATSVALNEM